MSAFRVVCGIEPSRHFVAPQRLLRAHTVDEALAALDDADRARRDGAWVAGYLSYELGAAFVHEPVRPTTWPLLVLGIFAEPKLLESRTPPEPVGSATFALQNARDYAGAIESIRRAIYDGDVYQVNYTVPLACAVPRNPFDWWSAIANKTGARYQAYVEDGDRHILSWSPELFLAFDGERIETRPMKGTAPLSDLGQLANAKNRAEHVMIVDLLRNDLHRICDDVVVERLFEVERYPTFATMTSTIAGRLDERLTLRDIFAATFPCGSITGAPKRAAIAQIASLEAAPRDVYCGSIGFLSPQRRGWWNVAIRTAQFHAGAAHARFDAGGGIVADSRAEDEWAELHVKTAFLRDGAEPIALLETFAGDAPTERVERHLTRLGSTASRFGVAFDRERAQALIFSSDRDAATLVRLRLALDGSLDVRRDPLETPREPLLVAISSARVFSDDPFLRVKTSHRPQQQAAAAQASARGCFDALLRNERDEFTEGSRANLFIERGGVLYTPPLACGVLPGILRSILVSEGRAREAIITIEDLERADAIYLGNSARGLIRATIVNLS